MPTIFRYEGYRFYFYANEGKEPPHVHVEYGNNTAKFWLEPVMLAKNYGMSAKELKKASMVIEKKRNLFKEKWNAFFSKKN